MNDKEIVFRFAGDHNPQQTSSANYESKLDKPEFREVLAVPDRIKGHEAIRMQ
jgi:hypothetical protein